MEKRQYGHYKEFDYFSETKNEDIRKKIIELISEIDLTRVVPEWNTIEIILHDYLDGDDPLRNPTVAIRFFSTEYYDRQTGGGT